MAKKTRLGLDGYGVRRTGSFAGKPAEVLGAVYLDPAQLGPTIVLSNLNLTATQTAAATGNTRATAHHPTGKYYHEFTVNTTGDMKVGLCSNYLSLTEYLGQTPTTSIGVDDAGGWIGAGGTITAPALIAGHTYGMATDIGADPRAGTGKAWLKDITAGGNWNADASANPVTGVNGATFFVSEDTSWTQINGLQPSIAADFTKGKYYGMNFADLATARTTDNNTINSAGSTIIFSNNQVRISDLGVRYTTNDSMTIGGALGAALLSASGTLVVEVGISEVVESTYDITTGPNNTAIIGSAGTANLLAGRGGNSATGQFSSDLSSGNASAASPGNTISMDGDCQAIALSWNTATPTQSMSIGGGTIITKAEAFTRSAPVYIGRRSDGAAGSGLIRSIRYFPTAYTGATLQALVFYPQSLIKFVNYGDSMSAGDGASLSSTRWLELLSNAPNPDSYRDFQAQGGTTSTQMLTTFNGDAKAEHRTWVNLFWTGHNDPNPTVNVANIQTCVAQLTGEKKYLVLLQVIPDGTPNDPTVLATRSAYLAAFPNRCVDVPAYLAAANNGSTQDLTDISNGYTPTSLQADTIHLNDQGQIIVKNAVWAKLNALGWSTFETKMLSEDFSRYADATAMTGQVPLIGPAWGTTGASIPQISGGYLVNSGSGYLYNILPSAPTTMTADVSWTSTSAGNITIAFAGNNDPFTLNDLIHMIASYQDFSLTTRFAGGSFVNILGGAWTTPMVTDGRHYHIEMAVEGDTVVVTGPSGELFVTSHASVSDGYGKAIYWQAGTVGRLAKVSANSAALPANLGTWFDDADDTSVTLSNANRSMEGFGGSPRAARSVATRSTGKAQVEFTIDVHASPTTDNDGIGFASKLEWTGVELGSDLKSLALYPRGASTGIWSGNTYKVTGFNISGAAGTRIAMRVDFDATTVSFKDVTNGGAWTTPYNFSAHVGGAPYAVAASVGVNADKVTVYMTEAQMVTPLDSGYTTWGP